MKSCTRNKPLHQHELGADWLENSFVVKDLRVLGDAKMNVIQQRAIAQRRQIVSWAALGKILPAS